MSSRYKNAYLPKRIVLCGSMTFYVNMLEQKRLLRHAGILAVTPDPDSQALESMHDEDFQEIKRVSSMKHIRRVRDQRTFGILVVNPDKHGVRDYIGPNTFAEIAVAFAHYKRIYIYQDIPDFYRDELRSWQAKELNCSLQSLISDYQAAAALETMQLTLFDL